MVALAATIALVLVGVASVPMPLHAQRTPAATAASAADSVAAIAEAQRAQRRFERVRRAALPILARSATPACDVRIGRYCYWHDATAKPPVERESESLKTARLRFLAVLDSLGDVSPRDAWIIGQRIRYRIDARDTTGAVGVASSECRTGGWWCDALHGYALHIAGEHVAAGEAFDRALEAMPDEDRCAWENPAALLERPGREAVHRLPCVERRRVADRLWWLATPRLSRPGNDLRTEFLARRVESALEANARFIYGERWGWDNDELLIRYGWPTWWTRERTVTISGPSETQIVGHERVPAFNFLPAARAVLDTVGQLRNPDWQPAQATPAMRYAPPYLVWWRDASAQVTRVHRGDTLLVIGAFEAPPDSMLGDPVAHLVLSGGPGGRRYASHPVRSSHGVLQARMPRSAAGEQLLASVEIVDEERRAMARYRESLDNPATGRLALSDMLLHRPLARDVAAVSLGDVIENALPGTTLTGDRVGIYWETYGVARGGEMLQVSLTIERLDTPWLRRAATRLRLADKLTPVQIHWRETPRADGTAPARTVSVSLANLANGEYRLKLHARAEDGAEAASVRVVKRRR